MEGVWMGGRALDPSHQTNLWLGVKRWHGSDSPDLAKWASLGHMMEDPRLEVI